MKKNIWLFCKVIFVILSILTFTPLVIPNNQINPILFGLPRTLWLGILISLSFILLTILGAIFINSSEKKNKK